MQKIAQSAGAVEYSDCTAAERVRLFPNECSGYDIKQSDCEAPKILKLWGMQNTLLLPLLPDLLWPGVVAPDRFLSMGQIQLNRGFGRLLFLHLNCVFTLNWIV